MAAVDTLLRHAAAAPSNPSAATVINLWCTNLTDDLGKSKGPTVNGGALRQRAR